MLNRVALLHAFGFINSVCHLLGTRPFRTKTGDQSTNNLLVSLLIFGEGWHNNHHAFPGSAHQGMRWYQIDPSWYVIVLLEKLGLARNVRRVPPQVQERKLRRRRPAPETSPARR
jgi:stearoyl-CoA desaturase (delta-9 desaturase)